MVEFAPARRAFSCPNLADTDGLRANSLTSATSTQVCFPRSRFFFVLFSLENSSYFLIIFFYNLAR